MMSREQKAGRGALYSFVVCSNILKLDGYHMLFYYHSHHFWILDMKGFSDSQWNGANTLKSSLKKFDPFTPIFCVFVVPERPNEPKRY